MEFIEIPTQKVGIGRLRLKTGGGPLGPRRSERLRKLSRSLRRRAAESGRRIETSASGPRIFRGVLGFRVKGSGFLGVLGFRV